MISSARPAPTEARRLCDRLLYAWLTNHANARICRATELGLQLSRDPLSLCLP